MNCIASQSNAIGFRLRSIDVNDSNDFSLPNFEPGSNDVLIGRGKKCSQHEGNKRLRHLVASKLDKYSAASTKKEKTKIILSIVSQVRMGTPKGGFIKLDPRAGQWLEVGDFLAREKVSQAFRDALHRDYRSSNEFKKKRKREQNAKGYSFMQSSKRSRSHLESFAKQEEELEIDWANDDLSSSLTISDMECSMGMNAISGNASKLRFFLLDSSSLTSWFEDESNPFEPTRILEIAPKDVELYEPLPLPDDFERFIEEMNINNDFIPVLEKKLDETNCQPLGCKDWSSHPKCTISKPSLNSCVARSA